MELTKHYLISGRVQGVGYRAFTHRTGRGMGLKGWVRNLTDGRVEAVARGPQAQLIAFETELRRGPASAQVDQVASAETDAEALTEFEVRKDGV